MPLTKPGSDRTGLTKPGSDRTGLTKPGSDRNGSTKLAPDQTGLTKPDRIQKGQIAINSRQISHEKPLTERRKQTFAVFHWAVCFLFVSIILVRSFVIH